MESDNRLDGDDSDKEDGVGLDMFQEPEGFRPPTPPDTEAFYDLIQSDGTSRRIVLSLVGSHPLWGHHLWNAAPTMSDYLAANADRLCKGKRVLELGAAAGLPSIVAHHLGARTVVTTDYPDADLMSNLQKNVNVNCKTAIEENRIQSDGYIWGHDVQKLLSHVRTEQDSDQFYDVLLLSDLIFNHQAHPAMLETMDRCLPKSGKSATSQALVFFTHHRPHLADKDMAFFEQARQRGWTCEEVGTWKMSVSDNLRRRRLLANSTSP